MDRTFWAWRMTPMSKPGLIMILSHDAVTLDLHLLQASPTAAAQGELMDRTFWA